MESLCKRCSNAKDIVSGRSSVFLLCQLSQSNTQFAKYPPQPVFQCEGFEHKTIGLTLELMSDTFAICRLDPTDTVPDWVSGEFTSITRSENELSIVCSQHNIPDSVRREVGWRCFRVVGPLDFSMVGVIAGLTHVLARENLPVFVLSSFDTDYILVRGEKLLQAVDALKSSDYRVEETHG